MVDKLKLVRLAVDVYEVDHCNDLKLLESIKALVFDLLADQTTYISAQNQNQKDSGCDCISCNYKSVLL